MIIGHADLVILGLLAPASEVGVYRVAAQIATFAGFGLVVAGVVVAPRFASLHQLADRVQLQRVATLTARGSLLMALSVTLVCILAGLPLLRLVFGEEFTSAYIPLLILLAGYVGSSAVGAVALLLNMTGFERQTATAVAGGAALNLILNVVLIPPLGAVGAAIAGSTALLTWNTILFRTARQKLGIQSSPFVSRRTA